MRLAFSDIKKTISRHGGEPRLVPYLLPLPRSTSRHAAPVRASGGRTLAGGHPTRELDALIALYESYVGQARATWPDDRAATLLGDYRLARCLENVLSEWYVWQSPTWPEAGAEAAALVAANIVSSSQLRLALYDFVSASHGGFLPASERDVALDACAADLTISRATLEGLLYQDGDARAILARVTPAAPSAAQLATRYNQRVLEAVLANAAQVEWLLTPEFAATTGEPLGTTVKRVCFLARRMGVQYDIAYEGAGTAASGQPLLRVAEGRVAYQAGSDGFATEDTEDIEDARTLDVTDGVDTPRPISASHPLNRANLDIPAESATDAPQAPWPSVLNPASALIVTLYGPQEMTGAPNQYGERLARLCRALLGYRRATDTVGRSALAGAGLTGTARVYLHGRPLLFELNARLLSVIGASAGDEDARDGASVAGSNPEFDSSLEARLHEQFAVLEREGEARGWRLDREPEPILAGTTILVPDFALTRGSQRVYLEIAGYWRPEYRERKVRKLAAVRGRVALALAAPQSARAEFVAFERDFPILWYKDSVSAEALLALLDRSYNDLEARLVRLAPASIIAEITARGYISPVESMALLRCYSRDETARALDLLRRYAHSTSEPAPEWLDGIGLCSPGWLASLMSGIQQAVMDAKQQRLPLAELVAVVAARLTGNAVAVTESSVEALARRAGLGIMRTSIFDAEVYAGDAPIPGAHPDAAPPNALATQPRRRPRRTHTRTSAYTTQSIFPPEQPGPDNPEPDIPTRAP